MPRRAARTDSTARELTQTARQLGAIVVPLNSIVDALVYFRGTTYVVDWKSKGGHLTPAQQRLVIDGFPLKFISSREQLLALLGVEG